MSGLLQLRRIEALLSASISKNDFEWNYYVPNLPSQETLDAARYIKSIKVTSTKHKQEILLTFEPVPTNRVTASDQASKFVLIGFADFRLQCPGQSGQESVPAPQRESADYVVNLLRAGVTLNGVHYNFYGHSNSQLKSRSCLLYAASKDVISQRIESLGDFSKLQTVGKKVKRIGLLFSSADIAVSTLDPKRCEDISDVQTGDYIFTDGCGLISPKFANILSQKRHIVFRGNKYVPSVFQIRYRGYKGVLMVDPRMGNGDIWVKFRDSMKKFRGGDDFSFSVVEYSKPYTFGNLNDELVLLINTLGISTDTLVRKQQDNFEYFDYALTDPKFTFLFLTYMERMDLAERMILDGVDAVESEVRRMINIEYNKLFNKRGDDQRCRILIPQSRILFGVCDPYGILKDGECSVTVTLVGDGRPVTLSGAEVLVGRNPCLHPGDVRKLKTVRRSELLHLVDCIVFPTKGRRPHADMMSGGDLDGDKFFVTWDKDLIPRFMSLPAEYPGGREPITFDRITDNDRLEFFARYTNASLGRVKNLYLEWARLKGAMCPECQQLNRLFSSCVDGVRIRVPKNLEEPPKPEDSVIKIEPFVLDVLHAHCKEHMEKRQREGGDDVALQGYTFNAVEFLLAQDAVAMSEFEVFKLTYRWCLQNDHHIVEFLHFFDFAMMKEEEKTWIISLLPPTMNLPALVGNGLLQSAMVSERELEPFKLQYQGMRWKRFYSSEEHSLRLLLDSLGRALNFFHKKLLLMRVDERLTVAIYIPRKSEPMEETVVDDSGRLFAFTHSHDGSNRHRLAVPTKKNYRLYYDSNAFQLYEGQRSNSFIFLNRSMVDTSGFRGVQGRGDRRRAKQTTIENGDNYDWRASVALDKFSKNLQRHIGRVRRNGVMAAEIYVISNRDIRSQQILDLWLDQIDTEETLALFEKKAREYSLPDPQLIHPELGEPSEELRSLIAIVQNKDLSKFHSFKNAGQFQRIFEWLWERDERGRLGEIFDHILFQFTLSPQKGVIPLNISVFRMMLRFLRKAHYLAIAFSRLAGKVLPEELDAEYRKARTSILNSLILCVNEIEELAIYPFKNVLKSIEQLYLTEYAELVETVCLAVISREGAVDLLLDALKTGATGLLVDRPLVIDHFTHNMHGIALEHISEAWASKVTSATLFELKPAKEGQNITTELRLDAPRSDQPRVGDHVRLTAASSPLNAPVKRRYRIHAVVDSSYPGGCSFRCIHPPPPYFQQCSWRLRNYGSFTTAKTMMDAVVKLFTQKKEACGIFNLLLDLPPARGEGPEMLPSTRPYTPHESLNPSQNTAVGAAVSSRLTCLWGPPGTGKTYTIVAILQELLERFPNSRLLVAAPTHNATDNVMQKYLQRSRDARPEEGTIRPLRLSTDIYKVADVLKRYTVDAMVGKDLNENPEARKKVLSRLSASRLVFSTCAGAGLGLLRTESFDIVVIDEASQQTEPTSLIPLVKGCKRAILVGDHVQLRATVKPLALVESFDVSLFERLYREHSQRGGVRKVMLDTQYRMHKQICAFSSAEFYDGKLKTGVLDDAYPLPESEFVWPQGQDGAASRCIFIHCAEKEDLGMGSRGRARGSKSNKAQAQITYKVVKMLRAQKDKDAPHPSIAVLTPYVNMRDLMKQSLSSECEVSTIDAFQGREADIVIFATVRSNDHNELGFLKDMRRLNVALTRAKMGLIVIGNKNTLTQTEDESAAVWKRLVDSYESVVVELEIEEVPEKK